jgi:methylenetetrahydrofolate dehydrogenase (NADP+)/methenyltetrahydrofolate cyclohydrolase
MIFDGRSFAKEIEAQVSNKVMNLVKRPKIVSVLVGNDPASELYSRLKKSAAERCGIDFLIERLEARCQTSEIKQKVEELAHREEVTGLMVQLPLPRVSRKESEEILTAIPLEKDVDGLRWSESGIRPATVRAVTAILDQIKLASNVWNLKSKFVVLGSRGAVGAPLVYFLKQKGVQVTEIEWDTPREVVMHECTNAQIVISCVGKAGLVTREMVSPGLIAIDVGMSQKEGKITGDMTQEVYQKAGVAVPVPGGVGPVTIACLMQNASDIF